MYKVSKHARRKTRLLTVMAAVAVALSAAMPAAQAQTTPPFEVVFPQDVEATEFIDSYGYPRSGGRSHAGNDLMAPKMTEVYAIADGVAEVRQSEISGRYLKIHHAEGWYSLYIHLNNDDPGTDNGTADWSYTVAAGVEDGAAVKAGQLVGWVGDSGNAETTPPHTHFELRHHGRAIDPYPILAEAREAALAELAAERRATELQAEKKAAAEAAAKEVQRERWAETPPVEYDESYLTPVDAGVGDSGTVK